MLLVRMHVSCPDAMQQQGESCHRRAVFVARGTALVFSPCSWNPGLVAVTAPIAAIGIALQPAGDAVAV